MGETIVVAAGPLGATLFAFDVGGVDQPPLLSPLGCAGMGLVVSDVLRGETNEDKGRGLKWEEQTWI